MQLSHNVPTNGRPDKYDDVPTLEVVRATVPEDRLLVFDVRQGWEPLCRFLDVPVPDEPFPHINDRIVVDTIIKVFVVVTWIWPVLFSAPFLLAYYLLIVRRRKRKEQPSTNKKMS